MTSSWWTLIPHARAGQASALEEVQFALGPWVHGVLLVRVRRDQAGPLAAELLARVLAEPEAASAAALLARLLEAARACPGSLEGEPPPQNEAHRALAALRALPVPEAERAVLRLVEGVSGPDLLEVLGGTAEAVRAGLVQAVQWALSALGVKGPTLGASTWLWSMEGTPEAQLGKLEIWLSDLRHDWSSAGSKSLSPMLVKTERDLEKSVQLYFASKQAEDAGSDAPTRNVVDLPAEGQLEQTEARGRPALARPRPPEPEPDATTPVGAPRRPLPVQVPPAPSAPRATRATPEPEPDATTPVGAPLRPLPVQARPAPSAPRATRATPEPAPAPELPPVSSTAVRPAADAAPPSLAARPWRIFPIAFAFLAGSALMSFVALKAVERQLRGPWRFVEVLVAKVDLPEGTTLSYDNVAVSSVPDVYAPPRELVAPASLPVVLGQPISVPMQAGDPVLLSLLRPVASERLSERVFKRSRAYTFAVSGTRAVGEWVKPDDTVDLLLMLPPQTGTTATEDEVKTASVRTLMQRAVVLATGRRANPLDRVKRSEAGYSDVTLLMLPEEAEQLALAAKTGSLSLTLRNGNDLEVDLEPRLLTRCAADGCTLLDGERVKALSAKRLRTIQVIRNGSP